MMQIADLDYRLTTYLCKRKPRHRTRVTDSLILGSSVPPTPAFFDLLQVRGIADALSVAALNDSSPGDSLAFARVPSHLV
jgi:hypothetical protein